MKQVRSLLNSETFAIQTPLTSADNVVCTSHQLSLSFSADINPGATVVVSANSYGADAAEPVTDGDLDAYALRGTTRTVSIYGLVLGSITVAMAGRVTGTVSANYLGWGAGDPGRDDAYVP